MAELSIVQTLGRHLWGITFNALPADVVELAKTRVLNGVAVSMPGKELPAAVVAWETVKGNSGPCTLIGRPEKVPAEDAALANGAAGHMLLQEDVGAGGHPSVVVIPAALAVGEEVGASGRDVLAAIVVGYEAQGRMSCGLTSHTQRAGFRTVSLLGVFAAAATAAKLFGLDSQQTADALGFAGVFASGYYQGCGEGAMEQYFEVAIAAQNGVRAARIARHGGVASTQALEGANGFFRAFTGATENAKQVVDGLGDSYEIRSVMSKPYATPHSNHDPIDLATELAGQIGEPDSIRYGILRVSASSRNTAGKDNLPPFHNHNMAQMSLRFCVASALLGRPVRSFEYFRDHYDDREVWDLAYRLQVIGDEGRSAPSLELSLDGGRSLKLEENRSYKWKPDSEELKGFFDTLAGPSLGAERAAGIKDTIMALNTLTDIRELTAKLSG